MPIRTRFALGNTDGETFPLAYTNDAARKFEKGRRLISKFD